MRRSFAGRLLFSLALAVVGDAWGGCGSGANSPAPQRRDDGAAITSDAMADEPAPDGGMLAACPELAPPVCPDPPARYADVQPIIEQRCVVCHYGAAGGPWPLNTYKDIADWWDVILDDLIRCTMPPPETPSGLTAEERQAFAVWLACGFLP